MQTHFVQSRARAIVAFLTATMLLSACGSKPETSDISAQLLPRINCNRLVFKDVKKIDGMEAQNKQYQVTYTFVAEIKGGKIGAADFLSKWKNLEHPSYPEVYQLLDCDAVVGHGWLTRLYQQTDENLAKGPGPIPIPFAVELQGNAMMKKAESGWVFTDMDIPQVIKVIQSEPMQFNRPKPPIPATASNTDAPTSSPTGVLAATAKAGDVTPVVPQGPAQATAPAQSPAQVQGPSFDCAKATTQVEKAICGDAKLAALDVAVVNAYKNVLLRAADKDAAKAQQAEWRRSVRDVCPSAECLADAYQRRLAQLN